MLELLTRYARDHALVAEPGFAPKAVRWAIVCNPQGRYLGLSPLGNRAVKGDRGQIFARCPDLSQPELKRGGAGCRHFLVDTAEVVALYADEPDAKLHAKHAYFAKQLHTAAQAVPMLAPAAACLADPVALAALQDQLRQEKAKPTDNVTFAVQGEGTSYLVDSDAWHDWWRAFRETLAAGTSKKGGKAARPTMLCLASGREVEPASTHPKISGLIDVGGHSAGDVLASFKQESFCSYGLEQSANAAVSEEMAAQYRAALNQLLREHSTRLAGARFAHWFKKHVPPADDPLAWLEDPPPDQERQAQERARKLLHAIRAGDSPDLKGNHYYALALSGAAGRVMVRGWVDGPFEELVENIGAWFEDLSIIRRDGLGDARNPKFFAVLGATVRDLQDLAPPLVAEMWKVAVTGKEIPQQAMAQALLRVRIDVLTGQSFNHARMGLLKAYHVRKGDKAMHRGLNEDHPAPAYHCGRLLAVLAAIQLRALPGVSAGIIQRYYAAASATPALVFGRLVRNSQFHLEKLDDGAKFGFEKRLADILSRIGDEFPKTLALHDQSIFALGYYHQQAGKKPARQEEAPTIETSEEKENG